LVEKPLAATVAEADDLVETARKHAAILQVGHIERFNPAFVAATARVGRPQYIDAVRASGFTGRSTDIGVVHDLMIHDIDLVLSLCGAPLVRVDAVGVSILGRNEDATQARLEFADGCVANLSASRVSYSEAPNRRMNLWSAQGFAAIDFGDRSVRVVTPSEQVRCGEFDYESLSPEAKATFKDRVFADILRLEPVEVESRNALADELRDFVDAVRNHTEPRVTGLQGRDALAVAEAVLESMHAHRWNTGESLAPAPILRGPHWKTPLPARPVHREAG
jgi:predicted dehydrogenase